MGTARAIRRGTFDDLRAAGATVIRVAAPEPDWEVTAQPPFTYPPQFHRKVGSLLAEYAILEDVYVLPFGYVLWGDLLLSDSVLFTGPVAGGWPGELRLDGDSFELQMARDAPFRHVIRHFDEPTAVLTNFRRSNFYHFCHDVLGKTLCLDALEAGGERWRVALGGLRHPMMTHLLQAFLDGRPVATADNRVGRADCVAHYRKAAIFSTPALIDALCLPALHHVRRVMRGLVPQGERRPVYISREDGRKRSFNRLFSPETSREMSALMSPHGVREVTVANMSVDEQLSVFGNASAIIGLHGAGLTNMLFAPDGCMVIEIGGVPVTNNNFARDAQALGFRHVYVPSTPEGEGVRPDFDALAFAFRHMPARQG